MSGRGRGRDYRAARLVVTGDTAAALAGVVGLTVTVTSTYATETGELVEVAEEGVYVAVAVEDDRAPVVVGIEWVDLEEVEVWA